MNISIIELKAKESAQKMSYSFYDVLIKIVPTEASKTICRAAEMEEIQNRTMCYNTIQASISSYEQIFDWALPEAFSLLSPYDHSVAFILPTRTDILIQWAINALADDITHIKEMAKKHCSSLSFTLFVESSGQGIFRLKTIQSLINSSS